MAHNTTSNALFEEQSSKTWTIRKIDQQTIENTKKAAEKSGMKIGAWVDAELSRAAAKSLENSTELSQQFHNISARLENNDIEMSSEKFASIEGDIIQLFRGQHNIILEQKVISSLLNEIKSLISKEYELEKC